MSSFVPRSGVPPDGITPSVEEEESIQKISASRVLSNAPMCRTLLNYLWQHRGEQISEYAIGTLALNRRTDFDPKGDATVRVHVARLRKKLKEYYEVEEPQAVIRFSIPLGTHELEVAHGHPLESPAPVQWKPRGRRLWFGITGCLALVLLSLWAVKSHARSAPAQESPELPRFWKAFIAGNKPVTIVVATPSFFIWQDRRLIVRDTLVDDFAQSGKSKYLQAFSAQFGPPKLFSEYVVMSDALAAAKLAQYLERRGEHTDVIGAPNLSLDSFADHNLIFLGIPGISPHLRELLERTNFIVPIGASNTVVNRHPQPGEPDRFTEVVASDRRRNLPGLILLLPGAVPGARHLLLVARETGPLAIFLSSPRGLELLDEMWARHGSPEYFESVVRIDMDGDSVRSVSPVALRPFPQTH